MSDHDMTATTDGSDVAAMRYPRECICPHAERPLGRLHGVDMGRGIVRMSTVDGCPQHDSCHGYTAAHRGKQPSWKGRSLYCPVHKTKNCPSRDGAR